MASIDIKLLPGFERQLRKFIMPDGLKQNIKKSFISSFNKSYSIVIKDALKKSQLMNDLTNGIIASIFGMYPEQQKQQIEQLRKMFVGRAIDVKLRKDGVTVRAIIENEDISKLVVTNTSKNTTVRFKWLQILIKGLTGDEINAKIMKNIGLSDYVPSQSIFKKELPSGVAEQFSRSGTSIMIVPEKSPRVRTLLERGFTRKAAEVGDTFIFIIKPHPNIVLDIFEGFTTKVESILREDLKQKLKNLPSIKV